MSVRRGRRNANRRTLSADAIWRVLAWSVEACAAAPLSALPCVRVYFPHPASMRHAQLPANLRSSPGHPAERP